jgi:hypothetical protein
MQHCTFVFIGVMENEAKMNKILETSNVTTTHPSFPLPQMHHQVALTQFARFSSPWFHPNPTNFVTSVQPFLPSSPMTMPP